MLYLIYGTDTHKSREKLHELLGLAKRKRPNAELYRLTSENWAENIFEELLVSQGLFEQKYTVVLDHVFEVKEAKEFVVSKLEEIKNSDQIFLCLEGSIDSASLKKIEKYAEKSQEFAKKEVEKISSQIFSVVDGIRERDRKKLWVSYLTKLEEGYASEEIHGIFFWQVKNMILASRAKDSIETGLSPFVYKTALSGSRKYTLEELQKMSNDLVLMTHKVRTGRGELDTMLEKWVLVL